MSLPQVVPPAEWQIARDTLLAKEKEATRARDAGRGAPPAADGANRQGLPLRGSGGEATLVDLFDERRQLIVYHFMFEPRETQPCGGCSMFTDNIGHLAHLHARDTSLVPASRAPQAEIAPFRERMAWTVPWFSAAGNDFNDDLGLSIGFGLSVFLRDGDSVFRTYFTDGRGVEALGSIWTFLDLTALGRQEEWEDSHRRVVALAAVPLVAPARRVRGRRRSRRLDARAPFQRRISPPPARPIEGRQQMPEATSYTLLKLTDAEDMAPGFGIRHIEARFPNADLDTEQTGLSYQKLAAGARHPFGHRHKNAEEVYVVLSGSGRVKLDDEIVEIDKLDAIRVAPGVTRAFEGGDGGLELLAFGPRHEGDGEVVQDWWTD